MPKVTDMMFSKKSLPILLGLVTLGTLFAFGLGHSTPNSKYEKILQEVGMMLEQAHYQPRKIDDQFSRDVFNNFLNDLDPEKNILLASDVKQLRSFEMRIDNELKGETLQFFPAVNDIYQKRMLEASAFYKDILSSPFDFTKDESILLDSKKTEFPSSEAARKEAWRKRLKYLALERYAELLDVREKNKGKDGFEVKTDQQLEQEARERVQKIMDRSFDRLKNKFTEEERFNLLVNTITTTMDPHTTFFPPLEKRYFDESMSGRFYGIGASLRYEEGSIKIATVVTGSPAWKSGQISVGDVILKVGQGPEEPQDLAGFDVEDAVKLIRGKKGTEVRLYLRKTDGTLNTVSIMRDEIILDETFARSAVVTENGKKVGYIFLPEFYADWERPDGARSSQDVAREIIKLKEQNVDGIVMDLRNNGGGSLYDVIQMVGFFIEDGPVVQVRDREGRASVLRDRDRTVLYDGPLTVLVNEFSASASEIFAAAIQDYKRGLVLGSTSTYGKGTVQRNIGLERLAGVPSANANTYNGFSNAELGTVKLTLQKFYRVNGGSTQLKGVAPDVVIPDRYEYLEFREKDNPNSLKWDEIQESEYRTWKAPYDQSQVVSQSQARVNANPIFNQIRKNTEWFRTMNDKMYSLNLEKYKQEQASIRANMKELDNAMAKAPEMQVDGLPQDANKFAADPAKQERNRNWLKALRTDVYLQEAVRVILDMSNQAGLVRN